MDKQIKFMNNKGKVILFNESDTIADLLRKGVTDIGFKKPDEPLEENWWVVVKEWEVP